MKKLFVIAMILVIASGLYAGGQQEESKTDEPAKLVMAIWGGDSDVAAVNKMLSSVENSLEGIEVEVLLLADFDKTITTRIVGGQQIDIMAVAESVHQFSSRNQLVSLNDLIEDEKLDMAKRFGANRNLYARDGEIFALPLRGGPMVVYCNMDLLEEKPEVDWTFEQFAEAAVKAYKKGGTTAQTQWGFVPAGNGTWWPWYTSFIYAAGGSILDDAGNPNFDDPATIAGLKNYVSFIHETQVGPSPLEMSDIGQTSPDPVFNSGKAAMITTGWWNVGSLQDADFNWDVAPIPNGKGNGTVMFGQGLAVTSVSENKKAAFKVIEALTSVTAQESIVASKWDIPSNVEVLSSDLFLNADWSSNKIDMGAVADAISKGAISLPYNPDWNQMHDVIGNVINEVLSGNVAVNEAAVRIQQELNSQVFTD